jgi:hypothetical protein
MATDLTKYIYEKMLADAKNYQWRMVFDTHKHALEIYFVLAVETEDERYVQDVTGNVNHSGELQFEEVICFYDQTIQRIVPENYLYAIPFDVEVGIEQVKVDAILKQLNIQISNGQSRLREFIIDDSQQEFVMVWNEQNMKNTVETLQETGRYSEESLTFLKEEDGSLVDQFKEEQHDGLERV